LITATVELISVSPYSQSKHHYDPKQDREIPKDYEARTWRSRMHVDDSGIVYIPPMALKNCISEAAKFLGIQVPGKGKSTYTKHFEAGLLVTDGPSLGIKATDVEGQWLFLPSDGVRGSGKRVDKCYPLIKSWKCTAVFYVLDEIITQDVFTDHLKKAGAFIGLGRFRPRQNGFYGRFDVGKVKWEKS